MKLSVKNKILDQIKKKGRNTFAFPSDFISTGDSNAVQVALNRLTKEGEILRLGQGIYYYPKIDDRVGLLYPSLEDIAYAVAKRDHIIITPTEEKALNVLGISTQVPINVVFLSNGPSKEIKIGKNRITFKNASNKRVAAGKTPMGLIIRAFEGIGEEKLTKVQKTELLKQLDPYREVDIAKAATKSARWIARILFDYLKLRNDTVVTRS